MKGFLESVWLLAVAFVCGGVVGAYLSGIYAAVIKRELDRVRAERCAKRVIVLRSREVRGLNPLLVKADEVVSRYGKNVKKED